MYVVLQSINAYFGGVQPIADTAILTLSVLAQFLLTYKKIESWYLWIAVNILAIYVYITSGLYLIGLQYALFLLNAFYGLYTWRNSREQTANTKPIFGRTGEVR